MTNLVANVLKFIIAVRIGFEETAYNVSEEAGVKEVCVRVFEPNEMRSLSAEITAVIETVVGTAGMY